MKQFWRWTSLVAILATIAGCAAHATRDADQDGGANDDASLVDRAGARCGDGIVQPGEECDDGNADDGDACNTQCEALIDGVRPRFEPPEMADTTTGILDPRASCRPRASRDGARMQPAVTVRYRVHQCTGSDGTPAVPLTAIRVTMEQVRAVYAPFGVQLEEESVRTYAAGSCIAVHGDTSFEASILAATPSNAIPLVFVRQITSSAAFSVGGYARYGGVAVVAGAVRTVVAHELGHVFGLAHTFACRNGVETTTNCADAGDFFCDTPPDRGLIGVNGLDTCPGGVTLNGSCTPLACSTATCADGAMPDARNLMSYYHCWPPRVSAEQQDFIRCTLAGDLSRLTEPPCVDECPSLDARECVGANAARVCGNFDRDACREWSAEVGCGADMACASGRCVSTCRDECPRADARECVAAGSVRVCGNFDGDPCLEWSSASGCATTERCVGGVCASTCSAGASCSTGNPCERGEIRCADGAGRCEAAGAVPPGTACGSGRVCMGTSCVCPAGQMLCDGACRTPGRCGGCADPAEVCDGRDNDCDGLVDEGLSGCGLDVRCSTFTFTTDPATRTFDVALPTGSSFLPMVEISRYDTNGEDDGGWDIDSAQVSGAMRFTVHTDDGSAGDRVSGRFCVLGLGRMVGGNAVVAQRVNSGAPAVALTGGASLGPTWPVEVTMPLLRTYWPDTDDDMAWLLTPAPRAARGVATYGGSHIEGDVVWLSLPPGYTVETFPFTVRDGATQSIAVPSTGAGQSWVFVDVTRFETGTDDDVSYAVQCGATAPTACQASVWRGNSAAYIEGRVVRIEGPR